MKALSQKAQFLLTALLSGGKVGAITMSSEYVVERVMRHIEQAPKTMIEYGPGEGVVTKALLKRLSPDGVLVVIESNPDFVKILRRINDPRLRIIEGEVEKVLDPGTFPIRDVDIILSSIPLSFLRPEEQERLIARTKSLLSHQGSCIIFHQYTTLGKKLLEKYFNSVSVSFEPRNIFPCFILFAQNKSAR